MIPFRPSSERRAGPAIPAAIEDAASDWLARRDCGFDAAEAARFHQWVTADARHAAAVAELEAAWAAINQPRMAGRGPTVLKTIEALEARSVRQRQRRHTAMVGTALAAAAAIAFVFFTPHASPDFRLGKSRARTVMLRPDRQLLPDGSAVELNAGAEIAVDFSPGRRSVRLVRGEALFFVAKDPARPFVVNAGGVDVRAVGTAFTVRYDSSKVNVLVTEGHVAVERASDGRSLLDESEPERAPASSALAAPTLNAGHRLIVPAAHAPEPAVPAAAVSTSEIAAALAWRQRRVEFTSTPLTEAVSLFNRGPGTKLLLVDETTADLRISGVFWTDDADGFARLLEASLGVSAIRQADGAVLLRR